MDNLDHPEAYRDLLELPFPLPLINDGLPSISLLRDDDDLLVSESFRLLQDERKLWTSCFSYLVFESRITDEPKRPKTLTLPCISKILELPIEILNLIFGELHPADLLSLTRISKSLRNFLLRPSSSALTWKASFARYSVIPDCPLLWSEVKWADFLFGDEICSICGFPEAYPDFNLLRKICQNCLHRNCVDVGDDNYIEKMLPRSWNNDRFWRSDVIGLKKQVSAHQRAINSGKVSAERRFKLFRDFRETLTVFSERQAEICRDWMSFLTNQRCQREDSRMGAAEDRLKKRLVAAGFEKRDVDDTYVTYSDIEPFKNRYATRKDLDRLQVFYETEVAATVKDRLRRERREVINKREDVVDRSFRRYEATVPAWSWSYMPYLTTVELFPFFRDLIHNPNDEPITEEMCADGVLQLPNILEDWIRLKMKELATVLPDYHDVNAGLPFPPEPDLSSLDLATSIFYCSESSCKWSAARCLVGWDEAGEHIECEPGARPPCFSIPGSQTARHLVLAVGMDPLTALILDMDRLNSRFVCMNCPILNYAAVGIRGRPTYNWRDAVRHHIDESCHNDGSHSSPSWALLNEEETADIRNREEPDPTADDPSWFCNHCPFRHLEDCFRQELIDHIRSEHSIAKPADLIDYGFYQKYARTRRVPSIYPMKHPEEIAHEAHAAAVIERTNMLSDTYDFYKSTVTPIPQPPVPYASTLTTFPPWSYRINKPGSSSLEREDCMLAVMEALELVEDWRADRLIELASQLPSYGGDMDSILPFPVGADIALLEQASSVYKCGNGCLRPGSSCLHIGREQLIWHLECPDLGFDPLASWIVATLLEDARVSPTITHKIMDYTEVVVRCKICGDAGERWNWNRAVEHNLAPLRHDGEYEVVVTDEGIARANTARINAEAGPVSLVV